MTRKRRAFALVEPPAVSRRKSVAFTLVELLVVVGIIALLVTILMPSLGRALELARKTICQTRLHTMGRGWLMYFRNYNDMLPQKHNLNPEVADVGSRFSYMIYCGNPSHTTNPNPDYINAGVLYKLRFLGDERNFVCPTIERNLGGWYDNKPEVTFTPPFSKGGGWWPVNRRMGTYSTYNRRRFNYYDDPRLSNISWSAHFGNAGPGPRRWERAWPQRADADIMLFLTGVDAVTRPGDFSWMADRFDSPGWALVSHVPGVNVLYLDGHVGYWQDPTWNDMTGEGRVLYDNGIGNTGLKDWYHDDIWMIIDGYHQAPVGQGH